MNLSSWIGLRYYRARSKNGFVSTVSVVSFLGLMLGMMAMVVVVSVMNGFDRELKTRILGAVPHVSVSGADDLSELLKSFPVTSVSPFRETDLILLASGGSHLLRLHGVQPDDPALDQILAPHLIQGSVDTLKGDGLQLMLGNSIVRRYGLRVGESVSLVVPRFGKSGETLRPHLLSARLTGTFQMGSEMDYRLGVMSLEDMELVVPGPVFIRVMLDDIFLAPLLSDRLRQQGYDVTDWTVQFGDFFQTVRMEKVMMFVLLSFVVAVASFGIVSGLMMLVASKRRDIAVLRTMGMGESGILRIFLVQGMGVALMGVIAGLAFGLLLANYTPEVMGFVERLTGFSIVAGTYFDQIPVDVRWADIVAIGVVGLIISLMATLYPSRRAARLNPAEVLRYE